MRYKVNDLVKKDGGLNILLYLLWIALLWASTDGWAITGGYFGNQVTTENIFQQLFLHPFIFSSKKMLSGFEVLVFLFSVYILLKYKSVSAKNDKYLIASTIIITLITLFNPNNELSLLDIVLHEEIRVFYLFVLLLFAINRFDKENQIRFLVNAFKIGIRLLLITAIYYLLMFIYGNGMVWLGRNVTITYGDTLRWITIFHIITFIFFLETKNKKAGIVSLLFLIVLLYSYRRSNLYLAIMMDMIMYALIKVKTYKLRIKAGSILKTILFVCLLIGAILYISPSNTVYDFTFRYYGAFSYFFDESSDTYNDSGHLVESIVTTQFMWEKFKTRFWGGGIGSDARIFAGEASSKIHNSFVYVWSRYGIYMTLYYLLILVLLLIKLRKILKSYMTTDMRLIVPGAILFLILYFILGWFNGSAFTDYLQSMVMIALIYPFINITSKDINILNTELLAK